MSKESEEILEYARFAREYALLGNYKLSIRYYNAAIDGINGLISTIDKKDEWINMKLELSRECELVTGIVNIAASYKIEEKARCEEPARESDNGDINALDKRLIHMPKPIPYVPSSTKIDNKNVSRPKDVKKPVVKHEVQKPKPEIKKYVPRVPEEQSLVDILEKDIVQRNLNVSWDDVADLDDAKRLLKEEIELPLLHPHIFKGLLEPSKGILMFGPPGTGKTLLAKAVASQFQTIFFNVTSSSLTSKLRGDSEKLIHLLFDMARHYAPTTVFIDEIDAIGSKRDDGPGSDSNRRVVAQLLQEMCGVPSCSGEEDDVKKNVLILGATNLPWDLDDAVIRRFEKRIYIPLPEKIGRRKLLDISLRGRELAEDVDLDAIAEKLNGYSGSDIKQVCKEAAMIPVRKKMNLETDEIFPIRMADFMTSLSKIKKSVPSDLNRYLKWDREFKAN